ncbi:hypothetical protein B484DRAFT_437866, partial [Ochromonadaceae sp. CCMP2298]
VNRFGCVGGRKHNPDDSANSKETVLFKDITVSRRHFEITHCNGYSIRDLGSAGGTFIRIPHGRKKILHPGMIILLGKHQFTVSSIDDGTTSGIKRPKNGSLNSEAILSLVENAEKILSDYSMEAQGGASGLSERRTFLLSPLLLVYCKITSFIQLTPPSTPTGQSFVIDKEGASLGRKATNSIPLLMKITTDNGGERAVNVDTAISSEHARVDFDASSGSFLICDGTTAK